MGFGDSSLSVFALHAPSRMSCSSAPLNAVSTVPSCCRTAIILGGVSSFDSRVPKRSSWRKRRPAIPTAESPRSVDAAPQDTEGTGTGSSQAQSHLDLLQRMTENSTGSPRAQTIRDQLGSRQGDGEAEEVVPLAKVERDRTLVVPQLTISQKRNIRRQDYLTKVSERNDAPFFAIVAAIVVVPPILILAWAVATGYVELFP